MNDYAGISFLVTTTPNRSISGATSYGRKPSDHPAYLHNWECTIRSSPRRVFRAARAISAGRYQKTMSWRFRKQYFIFFLVARIAAFDPSSPTTHSQRIFPTEMSDDICLRLILGAKDEPRRLCHRRMHRRDRLFRRTVTIDSLSQAKADERNRRRPPTFFHNNRRLCRIQRILRNTLQSHDIYGFDAVLYTILVDGFRSC